MAYIREGPLEKGPVIDYNHHTGVTNFPRFFYIIVSCVFFMDSCLDSIMP